MYSRTRLVVAIAVLAAGLAGGAGQAQDKKGEKPDGAPSAKTTPQLKAAEAVGAAYTMVRAGREMQAPEMLLAAARIIGKTSFSPVDTKDAKLASKASGGDVLEEARTEADALIQEALKMESKNADAIKALAAAVRDDIKEFKRGAIPGPRTINGYVDARYDKTDTFFIDFRGGEPAFIRVNNLTNRGDIDLVVYNLDGREVAGDRRTDDDARVSFRPYQTGRFRVVVRAYAGDVPLRYRLTTN